MRIRSRCRSARCVLGRARAAPGSIACGCARRSRRSRRIQAASSSRANPWCALGAETFRGRPLQSLVTLAGGHLVPGAVAPLPFAVTVGGQGVDRSYRLPVSRRALTGQSPGLEDLPLPWEGVFSERVTGPVGAADDLRRARPGGAAEGRRAAVRRPARPGARTRRDVAAAAALLHRDRGAGRPPAARRRRRPGRLARRSPATTAARRSASPTAARSSRSCSRATGWRSP